MFTTTAYWYCLSSHLFLSMWNKINEASLSWPVFVRMYLPTLGNQTNTQIYTFCIFFQSRRYNGIIIKCILPLLHHMPHIPHAGQLLWFGHGKGHWKWTHPSIENKQQNDWNIILSISEKKYWGSYISIIVDETSDVSKLEQFSISVSYLDFKGAKQERFLKFT